MKFQLHWLDAGQWRLTEVRAAETFEACGLVFAIHRPLAGNPRTWCVSEVTTGASLCVNLTGTKAQARNTALDSLAQSTPDSWQRTIARIKKGQH